MMLQGHPISTKLPEDLGFGERFWYWRGASGQSYIHSIYACDSCPPLPGAVFVVVRMLNGTRRPVAVGQFANYCEGSPGRFAACETMAEPGDELHVHLLARDSGNAHRVRMDLELALRATAEPQVERRGFSEAGQLRLVPA